MHFFAQCDQCLGMSYNRETLNVKYKDKSIIILNHIIDLGPDGGDKGGNIVATGTSEDICTIKESFTGAYLKH